ncbi:MAG TPA: glycosyltransferase, partial [Verrucomicrobiae bacterium]|nr:glycosyltransferase [Verrucomicrobiae bacterium]
MDPEAVERVPAGDPIALSVVAPAHDEAPNLVRLVAEVRAALDPLGIAWELIVVDDGSDDETPALLARLAEADHRLRPLRLARRSGQTAALAAGFGAARGRLIATLDADLQCAPAELPELIAALERADLACGVRTQRNDPPSRRLASALANLGRRLLFAPRVRDLACPLRVFRAEALARVEETIPLFDGAHRWLPALFTLAGLRVVQRPVTHHPRTAGKSKYTTRGRVLPIARELLRVLVLAARRSPARRAVLGLALLALAAFPFLYALGSWPLIEPDEGRNAEVAREMLALGQWSVPHYNGLPYLDKPVLLFWLIAGAFRALGVSELAARLPSAAGALATVLLTYDLVRVLAGRRRALLAAAVLATAPIVLAYARLVIFDMPLTALVTAALDCLVRARAEGSAWRWLPLAGLAMGLATLTKGPVGIAVPLLAWFAARGALPRPARRSGAGPILAGVAVAALVVVPWLAIVVRQHPDFLRYALEDETLLRLTSTAHFHRGGQVYYYLETLAWALGMWGVLLAALAPALVRCWRAGGPDATLVAFAVRAAGVLVVFFTCSASKRPHYILPALVPLALLAAVGIAADPERALAVVRASGRWTALAGVAALVAALTGFEARGGNFDVLSPHAFAPVGVFLLGWGAAAAAARRPAAALVACALFAPGLGLVLLRPLGAWAETRSSRQLATYIEPGAPVVCFETFRESLPFYLRRPVVLLSDNASALASNWVSAERARLGASAQLRPESSLDDLLDHGSRPYVLTSPWSARRLTSMTPRPLVEVHSDRR